MAIKKGKETIEISFPADLDFIPSLRRFVSEVATVNGFSPKYAYRSEIIVDEICNNAVKFGSPKLDSRIHIKCIVHKKSMEIAIIDEGGKKDDLERLRRTIEMEDDSANGSSSIKMRGRGLEIVRTLSNRIDMKVDADGVTEVHVIKFREDIEDEAD